MGNSLRSVWTGQIAFGLVSVPCKMFSATSDEGVKFNQLNSATGNRIRQKRIDEKTGNEVEYDAIVKGYPVGEERWIVVNSEELDSISPEKSKTIALESFVDPGQVDILAYDKNYYLGLNKGGAKAYALLVQALRDSGRVGIGRFVMRTQERLAALRVRDGVIICTTLCFADEIRPSAGIRDLDGPVAETSPAETKMASALIEALSGDFDYASYHDTYREQVLALILAKEVGGTIDQPESKEPTSAPDLLAALEASLMANKPKKSSRKTAAKKAKVA